LLTQYVFSYTYFLNKIITNIFSTVVQYITYLFCRLGSGELEFEEFVTLAAGFLTEDEPEDVEAMQAELKEAFRLYDKEGSIDILMIFYNKKNINFILN
jgi:Ca2+-binding EF-hand superfamily protein